MGVSTDLQIIRTRFRSLWTYGHQTVFDNAPETDIDDTLPFVRFGANPNSTERETFGTNGVHARTGLIWLQILVPKAEGAKLAYDIVDQFVPIFRNWRADDADLAVGVEEIRAIPNNDHFQVNVMLPYRSR